MHKQAIAGVTEGRNCRQQIMWTDEQENRVGLQLKRKEDNTEKKRNKEQITPRLLHKASGNQIILYLPKLYITNTIECALCVFIYYISLYIIY